MRRVHPRKMQGQKADVACKLVFKSMFENHLIFFFHELWKKPQDAAGAGSFRKRGEAKGRVRTYFIRSRELVLKLVFAFEM